MSKIKSLTALLLVAAVLLMSGCSNIQALFNKKPESDLYEITAVSEKFTNFSSVDVMGDYAMFLASKDLDPYELVVFDIPNNKIFKEISLSDCPLKSINEAKFSGENEITVIDNENEECFKYDLNLNKIGNGEYKPFNYDAFNEWQEADFISSRLGQNETYAYGYENDNMIIVFADDVNAFYFCDGEGNLISEKDKKILVNYSDFSESDNSTSVRLALHDIENAKTINETLLGTTKSGQYIDVIASAFNDNYACFIEQVGNETTGGQKVAPYIWKYNENPKNEDFSVRKLTEIGKENDAIIKELENDYPIKIYVNKPTEWGTYNDVTEFNASPIQVNIILNGLKSAMGLFPKGFVDDILDMPFVEKLNIYLSGSINGIDAYTDDFSETFELMFSFTGFTKDVVFHEFMHLIDNRIQSHYDDTNRDFFAEWEALNPEGFEYLEGEDGDLNENYFVSTYAMTNSGEDLAETFEALYQAYENEDYNSINNYDGVHKKAELLVNAIRDSFPSMKDAKDVCWEAALNQQNAQ